ncbi:ATP synthase subunit b, mitochondrial-like isoform X2 [Ctenocephalides felis]|uniref:ATP synthase subunit b, mitochondrial-like isoform X2 n=1 Tax=Ctenocephalides felis TaxID=7515 RepID=UPI000E6E1358|nr:ATP synthase subunit b, mitochondrial-like isoform X2 [Ctenocephalides felis]XP_026477814.1 ATP synthase subunit b, mitochondrial-like isoform X2 [Ctenocephalides felis]
MLSKASLLAKVSRPLTVAVRTTSQAATCPAPTKVEEADSAERDLVNFPRPTRLEHSPKVRFGFIPDSWFEFFYEKTGVTGPYMFGTGLITYLCSKEIYVMEHEFYTGISLGIICLYATKKLGPHIAKYLDKEVDAYADEWNSGRVEEVKSYQDAIEGEKLEQWRAEGQLMLMDAKRENVALQLEAAYRERAMKVYQEVKKRLDYQVEKQNIEQRIAQKHMVNWVVDSVLKSLTPDQEKENINKCIADLGALASRA